MLTTAVLPATVDSIDKHSAPSRPAGEWPETAAAVLALFVLVSIAVVALYHLCDSFNLDIGSGIFLGLAQLCREGQLYPDLQAGDQFGGTRYMPLPFMLHAGLAGLTGEYLISGKGLALALALILGLQVLTTARRLGCPARASFALAVTVLVSGSGLLAATTIRGDLLPVVLQMAALALAERPTGRRITGAGLLCALAILAKLTAVWAGVAILLHLARLDKRRLGGFLTVWLGTLLLGLAVLHLASAGRMLENLTSLSAAGLNGPWALARGSYRLLGFLGKGGSVTHCLLPLSALGAWLAWQQGRWTLYHTSAVLCIAILAVVFSDLGAVSNHLLDAVVLSAMVVASAWPTADSERAIALRRAFALAACWCLATCWAHGLAEETRLSLVGLRRGGDHRSPAKPLADLVGDQETLLSDDPWVAVSRGQRPVVLDAVSLARSVAIDPHGADALVRRIEARGFAKIVLSSLPAEPGDLDTVYFGRPVADAIRAHYRLQTKMAGYAVLVPSGDRSAALAWDGLPRPSAGRAGEDRPTYSSGRRVAKMRWTVF